MKIHDEIEEWMAGALCGALTPEEQQAFERHLAECPLCRSLYAEEQKMNTLLNTTFSELRPDPNFERRVLAGFREKTARGGFHPLRGLVWFVQLRPVQAVFAMLVLLAMVQVGALLTHERFLVTEISTRYSEPLDYSGGSSHGTTVLSGANTYTGATTINGGTLAIASRERAKPATLSGDLGVTIANDQVSRGILQSAARNSQPEDLFPQRAMQEAAQQLAQASKDSTTDANSAPDPSAAAADNRKLIRNASLELEVENFAKASDAIVSLVREQQGTIATQNSTRGENGKFQGAIVVKILPENLDRFLAGLRALGDVKNQTLGTKDVTKDYSDTDARLRNARLMEERLLDMLKKTTGKVSDLLQVEKELARVREQIEQMQGELKYYDALVAYATVTITLREKNLNQPAAFVLKERATLAIFARDVEKTFAEAKRIADDEKAQIAGSHVTHDENGRATATLRLFIAPGIADETIDRLKALGRVQNFNVQTKRVTREKSKELDENDADGEEMAQVVQKPLSSEDEEAKKAEEAKNLDAAKTERDKVALTLTISSDEETPVQQTGLGVLTDRVEEKTAQIKQSAATAGVEVKSAAFEHKVNGAETSILSFRLPMQKYAAFLERIKTLGKVKSFAVVRRDDTAKGDNAPVEIALTIFSQGDIVADDTGIFATVRKTLAQGFSSLMWSARMIGVTLAFLAPWALALGAVVWLVQRRRSARK